MVDGTHLIDLMHARGVQLVALFAPEHGLRGLHEDGASIGDRIDQQTGVRVYSLYGNVKKPTPEMLRGLDILLFDIQGIGHDSIPTYRRWGSRCRLPLKLISPL